MRLFFLFALISIVFISCGDDANETADVTLNFKLVNGGESIAAFDKFEYPLGYNLFLTKYSFFLSDIMLSNDAGDQLLLDYAWMDLMADQIDEQTANEGKSITLSDFPVGEYTQLKLNLGVDEGTNAMSPSDFSASNTLGNTGEYWAGWSSYIFHKIEGKIDEDGDGAFEKNIALHIGSDDAFRAKSESRNISISKDGDNIITFEIDLQDVMNIDGSFFDINAMPQVHSEMALPRVLPIMDALIGEF